MNKALTSIIIIVIVLVGGIFLLKQKSSDASPSDDNTYVPEAAGGPSTRTVPNNSLEGTPDYTPQQTSEAGATSDTKITTTVTTTSNASSVKSFTVTGSNFSFTPSAIKVNKGDTVKITFKNQNGTHDLRIDEFNVATSRIGSGQEETVTFIADKTGSFEYYCSVGSHRAMGMKGTLTVM